MSEFSERRIADLEARLSAVEQERDSLRTRLNAAEQALADLAPSPDGSYGPMNAATWKDAYIERLREATAAEARVEALNESVRALDGNYEHVLARAEAAEQALREIAQREDIGATTDGERILSAVHGREAACEIARAHFACAPPVPETPK